MKSVCLVAVYTNCMFMLSSCWPGMYSVLLVHLLVIVQSKKEIIKYKIQKNKQQNYFSYFDAEIALSV